MALQHARCHCGSVTITAELQDEPEVRVVCRDQACIRYRQQLFFVDKKRFSLLEGADNLSVYPLPDQGMKQLFCKACGQQTHMRWVAQDMIGVNSRLMDVEPSSIVEQPCELCALSF